MTNRFSDPFPQFFNSNPSPYAGGALYFYVTGTSTPQNTYSNQGLTVANPNPVPLLSDGRPQYDIWLLNAPYKVVLEDVNSNIIWTADPVETSDFSGTASFQVYNGNPNGNVAGTAGTVGSNSSSVVWDYVDNILYVCTVTGTATTAVWTAVNSSGTTTVTQSPTGYLTLASDVLNYVVNTDQLGVSTVYYSPVDGNVCPVWNGSSFINTSFSQLTLGLVSAHAANTIYDVFMFSNAGVPTLCTGPAWTSSTAGSSTRGTGVGTTQLSRLNGLLVNTVQFNGRNGSNTYNNIPANQATYLGSIYIDATAGQISCHVTFGQNRKWGVYNAYNQQQIVLQAGDATASWTYNTNTFRASNNTPASWASAAFNFGSGTACNGMTVLKGLQDSPVLVTFDQLVTITSGTSANTTANAGVAVNSITTLSGRQGTVTYGSTGLIFGGELLAIYNMPAFLGINTVASIEKALISASTAAWQGTSANMMLKAVFNG